MTAAMILQARMTSTRLPGKVLRCVGGRTVLEWVVRASEQVPGISLVCAAVPEGEIHDSVAEEAARLGTRVVRGPEEDVLERFRIAAASVNADEVMRVTTDCPMMDPRVCGMVLELRRQQDTDYACNNEPFSFPHGLDCEVFTRQVLERAAANATNAYDREHVTPWLKRHPSVSRAYLLGPQDERIHWRWTVDHPNDLSFLEAVIERMGEDGINDWLKVSALLERNPQLHQINREQRQR